MKLSSYIEFVRKYKGQKLKPIYLKHAFKKEVDKDDYEPRELDQILRYLSLSL